MFPISGLTQMVIFSENFESGSTNNFSLSADWKIVEDSSNYVLSCQELSFAWPVMSFFIYDFTFENQIKLLKGGCNLWFRHTESNESHNAYYVGISEGKLSLTKVTELQWNTIITVDVDISLNNWYKITVDLNGANIKVYIDDVLKIEYSDVENPILLGSHPFSIQNLPETHIYYDNIIVKVDMQPQEAQWVRTGGPWGGIGYDVRIDPINPDIIYVTDQWAGNHKSTNGGVTWYPNNSGIATVFGSTGQSTPIFCLTIDINNPDIVWCGTFQQTGIYRSTDAGEHWEKKVNGIPEFSRGVTFRGFRTRPGNSNVVFCGVEVQTDSVISSASNVIVSRGKIFKTTDFGENWREVLDSDALVRHILINPVNPDIMFASTGIFDRDCVKEEGVWKSTDGGETWFHANDGITDLTVCGLMMDPHNPEILWACTGREAPFGGDNTGEIFKTTNSGELWEEVYPKDKGDIWIFASITPSGPNSNIIYAASEPFFYVSTDGGISWSEKNYNIPGVFTGTPVGIEAHPTDENTVFINSYSGGVFRSTDQGTTWEVYSNGYTGAEMLDIIVDPVDPMKVLAVGRSGIANTTDGGMTWNGAGNVTVGAYQLGVGPIGGQYVLAKNHQNNNSFLSGAAFSTHIIKNTDRFNWVAFHDFSVNGIPWDHGPGDIEYSYSDSNVIYAGLRYFTLPLIIDRPQHYDPDIISYGMFKTTDGGNNWAEINNGLNGTTKNIQAIAVHPDNHDTVFAGLYGFGVYKTIDGGDTWFSANTGITSYLIASLAIDHNNPDIIFAGAEDGGLFKSINGGASWEVSVLGMDPEAAVRSIVIDPVNSQQIYAGDWHTGVYRSTDGGGRWWSFNEGLTQRSIQKLTISSDGKTLYAATQGAGVFRLSYENLGPAVQYIHPENNETITLQTGGEQEFVVGAADYNGDTLSYSWYLDETIVSDASEASYSLDISVLSQSNHTLRCDISDGELIEQVLWNLNVAAETNIYVNKNKSPHSYFLAQNYPNPFNAQTTITFGVKTEGKVLLKIYDILGREVKTLVNKRYPPGSHKILFDANSIASGVYLYEIKMGDFREVKKLVLLK